MIYAATLLAACILNREDYRVVLFSLLVALTHYLPLEYVTNYYLWYSICIFTELSVIGYCLISKLKQSLVLLPITILLLFSHIISLLTGSLVNYALIAPILEYLQIFSFIITSSTIITIIKGRIKCLQKFGCGY